MTENSNFGELLYPCFAGSQRAAGGGIAAAYTEANGLMRANRAECADGFVPNASLGETQTERYFGDAYVSARLIERYAALRIIWVAPQEIISCPKRV